MRATSLHHYGESWASIRARAHRRRRLAIGALTWGVQVAWIGVFVTVVIFAL